MRAVRTVAETRAAESVAPEDVLIDRAATAVARRAAQMLGRVYGARVLVLAGKGNNGADALLAGSKLAARGASVDVAPRRARPPYDLVIDGMLGIGGRPFDTRPEWASLLDGARALAVDLPSGVDADTGAVGAWAVRADATVTFGTLKPGLVVGAGAEHAGLVEVAPIGMAGDGSVWVLDAEDVAEAVRAPESETDKYRRGVVGIVAGSERFPGAAALACRGAQRAGCGYVRLRSEVRVPFPEVVSGEGRVNAWVVGPGLGDESADLVREVLASDLPVVVDADALRYYEPRDAPTVLTPHTGEFERLTGVSRADAERDRLGHARRAAADLGAVVLLKGRTTVVAAPDGTAYVDPAGTPWLATAGTGDVLAGAIGALLSRDGDPALAAARGAWLHGMAARLAADGAAVTALDVAEHLPEAARIALTAC